MSEHDRQNEHSARNLAEEALEIVIKNTPLKSKIIKALRLTCKRTKMAADARVKQFTLLESQEPEAVQRSRLLHNIKKLILQFDLRSSDDRTSNISQNLSRAVGLLNLAVDVCSKSLEVLYVTIHASLDTVHACGCLLGNGPWGSLVTLCIHPMLPGLLSGLLARPGSLPALKGLACASPSAADIESIEKSLSVGNLNKLIIWSPGADESSVAPATVAAMRNLLQRAVKVEHLHLVSRTCEYFDCEKLSSLKTAILVTPVGLPSHQVGVIDFAPALARPWTALESLRIDRALLKGPDLVRIFEAEDTLPVLKRLSIIHCELNLDALSCVRRPHLEQLCISECSNGHLLVSKCAQLMKVGRGALPSLRTLQFDCRNEIPLQSAIAALSELLSCPCMAALETLSIYGADIFVQGAGLLYNIVNYCPKLNFLDLRGNSVGRPALALLLGYGHLGAWPELQKLGVLDACDNHADPNRINTEHINMRRWDVQKTLRRVWPGLGCF